MTLPPVPVVQLPPTRPVPGRSFVIWCRQNSRCSPTRRHLDRPTSITGPLRHHCRGDHRLLPKHLHSARSRTSPTTGTRPARGAAARPSGGLDRTSFKASKRWAPDRAGRVPRGRSVTGQCSRRRGDPNAFFVCQASSTLSRRRRAGVCDRPRLVNVSGKASSRRSDDDRVRRDGTPPPRSLRPPAPSQRRLLALNGAVTWSTGPRPRLRLRDDLPCAQALTNAPRCVRSMR